MTGHPAAPHPDRAGDDELRLWIGAQLAAAVERLDPLLDSEHSLAISDGERLRRIAAEIAVALARKGELDAGVPHRFERQPTHRVNWDSVWYSLRDLATAAECLAVELARAGARPRARTSSSPSAASARGSSSEASATASTPPR